MDSKLKIVAPAGDMEKFFAAVSAGADEVYMGIKGFGARRSATNFTISEYKEALDFAHLRGVKIFLTLNTVMMDEEIEALYHNINELYMAGVDGIIVQDLGMFHYLKANFPDVEIHASTQMTVTNHVEAEYLFKLGFKRIVLARELSLQEIKSIREKTSGELEVFVSGALCVCYSGKCYMSSFIGARSGNRGMCAQPCRKIYNIDGEQKYLLSPKDQLAGQAEIDELKNIGVTAVKIEGRMKDSAYVFELTKYFKELINNDKTLGENSRTKSRIENIFNRGYSKGYFYDEHDKLINQDYSFNLGKKLGDINGLELKLLDDIMLGDGISYLSQSYEKLGGTYINKIFIKNNNILENKIREAKAGDTIFLYNLPEGTKFIYKSYSKKVADEIESQKKISEKKIFIHAKFFGKFNEPPKLIFEYKNLRDKLLAVEICGEEKISEAKNNPTSREQIYEKISELGDTTFELENIQDIKISENIFVPMSTLKNLKRELSKKLSEQIILSYKRNSSEILDENISENNNLEENNELIISAIVKEEWQKDLVHELGIDKVYLTKNQHEVVKESKIHQEQKNTENYRDKNLVYNFFELEQNQNSDLTLHWNFNVTNKYALAEYSRNEKIETIILSPELSFDKIKNLGNYSRVKKALLIYSKPKVMYIEAPLVKKSSDILSIQNDNGDDFEIKINELGSTEIFLTKPLDITQSLDEIKKLGVISEVILEFNSETKNEIQSIINNIREKKQKDFKSTVYNYWRGVY
ncbi:MAG: peptidase U32 family protein [Fusobacteriaceae bacterium]